MSFLNNFKMPEINIPSLSESFMDTVIDKVRKMEASLTPEQSLSVVSYTATGEAITVARLQFTNGMLIVVHGYDANGNPTYVMSSVFALQLVCRITRIKAGQKKSPPVGFVSPQEGEPKQHSEAEP